MRNGACVQTTTQTRDTVGTPIQTMTSDNNNSERKRETQSDTGEQITTNDTIAGEIYSCAVCESDKLEYFGTAEWHAEYAFRTLSCTDCRAEFTEVAEVTETVIEHIPERSPTEQTE